MLDLNLYEPSRSLVENENSLVVFNDPEPVGDNYVLRQQVYQFRYVVHRQHVGFFTPVVFDVLFKWVEINGPNDRSIEVQMNHIAEAFVEGAMFMNHTSHFIVDMLKGQEAGFDRKVEKEKIVIPLTGVNGLWYSDWQTPPITKQSQRIVIYDLESTGSMLDPVNVVSNFRTWIKAKFNRALVEHQLYFGAIVAGYTEKTK